MKWLNTAFALFFALCGLVLCVSGIALTAIVIRNVAIGHGLDMVASVCAIVGLLIGALTVALSVAALRQALHGGA